MARPVPFDSDLKGGPDVPDKKEAPKESFKEAFARHRKAGDSTFTWNGKSYNTKVKGEDSRPNAKVENKGGVETVTVSAKRLPKDDAKVEKKDGIETVTVAAKKPTEREMYREKGRGERPAPAPAPTRLADARVSSPPPAPPPKPAPAPAAKPSGGLTPPPAFQPFSNSSSNPQQTHADYKLPPHLRKDEGVKAYGDGGKIMNNRHNVSFASGGKARR